MYCFCCLFLLNLMTLSSGHRFCTDRSGNGDPRKRTEEDDVRFAQSFEKLILEAFKKMYGINSEIMNKIKYCLSTKKKDLCKRNLQTETNFDASCLQCMEYIGYSNKNCKVIYESTI